MLTAHPDFLDLRGRLAVRFPSLLDQVSYSGHQVIEVATFGVRLKQLTRLLGG